MNDELKWSKAVAGGRKGVAHPARIESMKKVGAEFLAALQFYGESSSFLSDIDPASLRGELKTVLEELKKHVGNEAAICKLVAGLVFADAADAQMATAFNTLNKAHGIEDEKTRNGRFLEIE